MKRLRRIRMGLATMLGVAERGFFIPYRYADSVQPMARYPAVEDTFARTEAAFTDLLATIDGFADDFSKMGGEAPNPRFEQDWFPRLDACALYALIRTRAPKRIVEIGSGHSTRFAARAVADGNLATRITAIDPAPRAAIEGLGIEIVRKTVQAGGVEPFLDLDAGDVLIVDSSHILMPGTDVDLLFNGVIPALPSGVLIHIHDICLPDAYPAAWVWRGYNEQQAAIPMITSGGFDVLWSSRYVVTRLADTFAKTAVAKLPLPKGACETSLWLRKR